MAVLKLIAGWPASWLCFWAGHFCSVLLRLDNEYWAAFWYPVYNNLMIGSSVIQDWAGGAKYFPWDQVSSGSSATKD